MKATRRRRLLGHAVALGVAYAGLSAMVTAITSLGATTGATFWPGAGLTVAVLLVCPRREWPALLAAVAIAEFAMDLVLGYGLGLAVSWALVNTAEPAVAAWLLRRGGRAAPDLSRLPDLARFVAFAVMAAPLLGALVGTTASVIVTGDAWWPRLPQWWVGDGIGALVVAPLLLLALTGRWHLPRPKQTWPLALLVATAGIALGPWEFPGTIGGEFLVLPVLGLVALRLRTPGAAVAVLFVATLVVVGTALGTGPFAQPDALHGLVIAQMFLAMNALAALSAAAVMTDLGSRDELERGLRRYNEALLNSAGDGICGLSVQGSVTFANPAALRLTGHDIDGLRGCDLHATLQHSRPDGTPYASQDSPILASLCDAAVHRCDRDVFWRKHRTSFPVEYTSTPLLEDDTTTGAVVIFKDISERREVERVKDELTSVVSHELRTPLASIRGRWAWCRAALFVRRLRRPSA